MEGLSQWDKIGVVLLGLVVGLGGIADFFVLQKWGEHYTLSALVKRLCDELPWVRFAGGLLAYHLFCR